MPVAHRGGNGVVSHCSNNLQLGWFPHAAQPCHGRGRQDCTGGKERSDEEGQGGEVGSSHPRRAEPGRATFSDLDTSSRRSRSRRYLAEVTSSTSGLSETSFSPAVGQLTKALSTEGTHG